MMNRLLIAVLTGLLCSWQPLSVQAATVDCVPHEGCPKNASAKKKCCELPKCEFFYALVMARAELYAYSGKAQAEGGLRYGLDESLSKSQASNRVLRDEMTKARANNKKCPAKDFYKEPPDLFVLRTQQCNIVSSLAAGEQREIGFEEFELRSNSCSEIVEAEWAKTQQEQFYCNRPYQPDSEADFETYRKRNETAARAKVRSLEESLTRYRSVCTKVSDAKVGRYVAKLGLKALKDDFKKKPKGKKKAKRAGRGS